MNRLRKDKQIQVVSALVEGSSIRSVERMTGVHRDTIMRLGIRVGTACAAYMSAHMRELECPLLQLDEIWCYVGKKQRHVEPTDDRTRLGDFWTFVAIDADSKLVPAFRVGERDGVTTYRFLGDLASRVRGRVQISTDRMPVYVDAIAARFGPNVDYGRIVKRYEAEPAIGPGRYSPPHVVQVRYCQMLWTERATPARPAAPSRLSGPACRSLR